jgi:hydrogenase nickel incorporation protein HypB
VTEGDDKPAKYPVIFRGADRVLITKRDLLPHLDDFRPERAEACVRALANDAPVLLLSAKSGAGMEAWLEWLRSAVKARREGLGKHPYRRPALQPDGLRLHGHGAPRR